MKFILESCVWGTDCELCGKRKIFEWMWVSEWNLVGPYRVWAVWHAKRVKKIETLCILDFFLFAVISDGTCMFIWSRLCENAFIDLQLCRLWCVWVVDSVRYCGFLRWVSVRHKCRRWVHSDRVLCRHVLSLWLHRLHCGCVLQVPVIDETREE